MEFLCVAYLFPEYDIWTQFVTDLHCRALELDALKSSHPVEVNYCSIFIFRFLTEVSYIGEIFLRYLLVIRRKLMKYSTIFRTVKVVQ